jgi:hypothetical protein
VDAIDVRRTPATLDLAAAAAQPLLERGQGGAMLGRGAFVGELREGITDRN